MARVVDLGALDPIPMEDGQEFLALRHALELTALGANAFRGTEVGATVIEEHDERSPNAGGHEELYVVVAGRATFVIDGQEVDAPMGTCLRINVGERRTARAAERGTTVLVVGARPGAASPPSPFEWWYRAEKARRAGDSEAVIAILQPGLAVHPHSGGIHYQLTCALALAGRTREALEHLAQAVRWDPRTRDWAQDDDDLVSLRSDPRWQPLIGQRA